MDSNQDPDFEENEFIYDELDLDDIGNKSSLFVTFSFKGNKYFWYIFCHFFKGGNLL